jgi:pyruvate/2-oxoglutarate dehydrogenase complex dihydrolipoamide dehydrogenase (E3) component
VTSGAAPGTTASVAPQGRPDRHEPWAGDDVAAPDGRAWDVVVVGAGAGGITAATTAAGFGASVLLVDQYRPGGDCLWTGCVPSKALLAAAHAAHDARRTSRFGIRGSESFVDGAAVMAYVHRTIRLVEPDDSPARLRAAGVRVAHGPARFTSSATLEVLTPGGGPSGSIAFRRAIIATGTQPRMPEIPGLAAAEPLTSDTVWTLAAVPQCLLIMGGGPIGCELGQAFARLGAQVTIVEGTAHLLSREDPDAADLLRARLEADGVRVETHSRVEAVESDGRGGFLARIVPSAATAHAPTSLAQAGEPEGAPLDVGHRIVPFDRILVALGRTPETGSLGLTAASVHTDDRGFVRVDPRLRTSNRRIWAAGDITGHPQLTHIAGLHGSVAATNAVLGLRRRAETTTIPRATFTQPEIASVGVGSVAARRLGLTVRTVMHHRLDRARADGMAEGMTRLVLDRRGRILGATIVSPRAGESLAELALAVQRGLRARDIAAVAHAYPTYSDGAWQVALGEVRRGLASAPMRAVIRLLARRNGIARGTVSPPP